MILVSLALILLSSYFILSLLENKSKDGFIYFYLICFSQFVITFELLSLFGKINKDSCLILNALIFLISLIILLIKRKPLFKIDIKDGLRRIFNSFKSDKMLMIPGICFIIFIISEYFVARYHPIVFGDALSYYLPRCTQWIQNGNINHFLTPDPREIIMPVNLEFVYTWKLLFSFKEYGLSLIPYSALFLLITVIYNFLGELGFCTRKRLYSIFVICSFAVIGVMSYTPCADLLIGALLSASLYLFIKWLKDDGILPLYFSALSAALAVGTKTTAIITLPSIFILIIVCAFLFNKNKLKKGLILYITFLFINFIIFSSYNYILNFLQFLNPVSCNSELLLNKFRGGIKGYACNFIKYIFMFFDASGIKNFNFYNNFMQNLLEKTLNLIGEDSNSYTSKFFEGVFIYGYDFSIAKAGLGIIGIIVFIPSFFIAIFKGLKPGASKKMKLLCALALSLLFNILLFSRVMIYTKYNFRYLVTFIIIAAPIVVLTYIKSNKNIYKWIIIYYMFVYLFIIAHTKPVSIFLYYWGFKSVNSNIKNIENVMTIAGEEPLIYDYFKKKNKTKMALIVRKKYEALFYIVKLRLEGFIIDRLLIEDIESFDLKKYEYIITSEGDQVSSYILKKYPKNCIYMDYEKNITKNADKAASVQCFVPDDYYNKQGFEKVKDINLKDFVILKNKNYDAS